MPAQVELEKGQTLEETTSTTKRGTILTILGTAILSLIHASSLNLVWGLIGSVQNVAYMALLNIKYPGNA